MTEYNFRQLNSTDIFPVCTILSKIGIREFKDCFDGSNVAAFFKDGKLDDNGKMALGASVTFDVIGVVLGNMEKCKNEIFRFLASVSDKTEKQLREMSPADFLNMLVDFSKKKELADFIKVVSKFFK